MALTWSSSQDNSSCGNINMRIWIGRGSCTRTATSVSFDFGVCFMPISQWTTNSIAAYYGGVAKYANVTRSSSSKSKATESTYHYAYYSNRNSTGRCTTETTCFSYSNSSIDANTTSVSVTIGVGWNDWAGTNKGNLTFSLSIPKYVGAGTKPSELKITQTGGSNNVVFSGNRGINGTNNAITAGTLYYKVGSGSWQSENLGTTSGSTYTKTITNLMTSTNDGQTVSAYVTYTFENGDTLYNYSSSNPKTKTCYYYGTGTTPGAPTISQGAGSNIITISGGRGNSPSHNTVKSSTLYYKFAGASSYESITLDTSSTTYSETITINKTNDNKKLSAKVGTEYTYGGTKTGSETTSTNALLYYSPVGTGSVAFTDNGNNTFSVTGTRGTNGSHNKAKSATLYWATTKDKKGNWTSTTQAFGTSGSGNSLTVNNTSTKSNISIPTNGTSDTVTVAGAVVTEGTYKGSTDTGWKTASINLYKAPTAPSGIKLSYNKSRLTVKENWTLEWTGGTKTNNTSPVKGYRIRTWVKRAGESSFTTIQLKNDKNEIKTTTSGSDANKYYYDRENTTTEMTVYPVNNDFKPGDQVYFTISCYTRNGNGSNAGLHSNSIKSPTYTVQNAGIMRVKVGNVWKEGTVWVKVGGVWKEATSVHTKVGGSWKEST